MIWIYISISLIIGLTFGFIIARLTTPSIKQQEELKKELNQSKDELEQSRQKLSLHFSKSSEMLETLAKDFNQMYEFMAKSSQELVDNEDVKNRLFIKHIENLSNSLKINQTKSNIHSSDKAPKDYSSDRSGVLSKVADLD